jgi:hypothetical protein
VYGDIVGNTLADDGDGVLSCTTYGFQPVALHEFQLGIDGIHKVWAPGHILGNIITDTEEDPRLTLIHEIDNETGYAWTDYHVEVTMSKAFSIDNVTVANAGWTSVTTGPIQVGSDWIGKIDYYAGDAVAPLGTLDFAYRMTFTGSANFAEQLTPTPEPATLSLLILGGLALVRRRRK